MNLLNATVAAVTVSEHLTLLSVTVNEAPFDLLLAETFEDPIGSPATLAFKETELILLASPIQATANVHAGEIVEIQRGAVLSEVSLRFAGTMLKALVPTRRLDTLGAKPGDTVGWMVSPAEISLLKETHGY